MKKLIKYFRIKIIRWYEGFIRIKYQKIRRCTNFIKEAYHIDVKKGELKYHLLIIETFDGRKLRFNLGRHLIRDCDTQELLIKNQ